MLCWAYFGLVFFLSYCIFFVIFCVSTVVATVNYCGLTLLFLFFFAWCDVLMPLFLFLL